ncbi:MAG TPA: Ig-like domain-containing protein, partial [Candidatus Limnocylindrales bacterium]|nr:Ig-like domain-containing protein [Candidatus Limnocylindrales bacterium]
MAVLSVVAIGAGLVLQGTQPRPSPSPGASSGPGAGTTPGAGPGDWAALELEPIPAVAALAPTTQDDTGIPSDAAFTLDSLAGEPAAQLAQRLEVSPAIALVVTPSTDARATVRPSKPLQPGATYRFALRAPDGSLAGSWLFRVRGAVQATSTIPGSRSTGVPVGTGIEVTFNQEGVADMANHFSISPEVDGRFERHGRTQVFVPDSLAAATLYTVTIRAGLARTGTDLTLPADVVFSFETAGPETRETRLRFGREVIEASPTERPVIAVRAVGPDVDEGTTTIPTEAEVRVYRIPSPDAAASSLAGFLAAPRWSSYADPLIPTDGMTVAASFTATLERLQNDLLLIRFPAVLDAGAYVVEIDGPRKAHAFLQVTTVSAWVSVMSDRTVAWVNDVATGRALAGATVALGDGPAFGRSNEDGLAIGDTPTSLLPPATAGDADVPATPVLTVTSAAGDTVLVPFGIGADGDLYRGEWWEKTQPADETYWAMLFTDRGIYRPDDRIEIWGYLRARDSAEVPDSVEVRLVPPPTDETRDKPAIASVVARPGASGAFTAALPIASAPLGAYQVQAVVDGRVVVSRWLEVTIIRKPPYQLALSTDHRAVIAGATVRWTAAATFFDGTPVPALEFGLSGGETDGDVRATTDAAGFATVPLKARTTGFEGERWEDATTWDIQAGPTGPEAAEVFASGSVVVFPSAYDLKASGVVNEGRLTVSGSLHAVDLAKVERQLEAGGWDGDAEGAPVAGRTVGVVVTELIPVQRLVGNEYDFVAKVVRPLYEYDIRREQVRVLTVESAANGAIAFNVTIPDAGHEYEVVLTTEDAAGRTQTRTIQAGRPVLEWWAQAGVVFQTAAGGPVESATYGVGDSVVWRMIDDGQAMPSAGDDRYLYIVAQRGLRSATVSDASTFRHTYSAADAPGIFVIGVRFTGTTYAPKAAGWANFDASERRINVAVSAERERYRPGEDVTLSVRTTRPNGTPVAATVVLQAVDEKLFAIGGASVPQPLDDLYGRVDSGIVRLTATHQVPTMSGSEGEGGDTTGGGPRSDFRDTLLFRELTTDSTGRASTTVKLSDDLTSWHVTASAVTAGLEAGADDVLVPVGLPFFVEATIADTYLVSDRPIIRLRAYGDALRAGDAVEFTVQSTSLGLAPRKVSGTAFEAVGVELPALSVGDRSVDVTATATTRKDAAGKALADRLIRSFEVVTSRLTAARTGYALVRDGLPTVPAGPGLATYTFTDAGRGRFLPVLLGLSEPAGARLDRLLAQSIARQRLIADFGRNPASLPPLELDPGRYPVGVTESDDGGTTMAGAALLPYGGVDPWLAARIAILAPNTIDANRLREALAAIREDPATLRDLSIATLAAFAVNGEPVLDDLREAHRAEDLTPLELMYLALGFEALGDDASAIAIERDLLDRYGERFGQQVRVRLGSAEATLGATALLSVVAAGLGDPVAAGLAAYVVANPGKESIQALELAAYAARGLDRTPATAASFAYVVAGKRTVVRLEPGDTFSLSLTSDQRSGLSAEAISGQVAVGVEWREPVEPGALVPHAALSITRTVPAGALPSDRLVIVDLTAKFADGAPENGCYDVVELVPSGLAPLAIGRGEPNEEGVIGPSSVVGQEVRFCAGNDARSGHTARMRYTARVVNDG